MTAAGERAFYFGPFRLFPEQQLLLEGNTPVRLGSRSLEILTVLVEHAGDLVSKAELMARVWPDTFVDESSLRVHVAGLRRALGDGQAVFPQRARWGAGGLLDEFAALLHRSRRAQRKRYARPG